MTATIQTKNLGEIKCEVLRITKTTVEVKLLEDVKRHRCHISYKGERQVFNSGSVINFNALREQALGLRIL